QHSRSLSLAMAVLGCTSASSCIAAAPTCTCPGSSFSNTATPRDRAALNLVLIQALDICVLLRHVDVLPSEHVFRPDRIARTFPHAFAGLLAATEPDRHWIKLPSVARHVWTWKLLPNRKQRHMRRVARSSSSSCQDRKN